MSVYYGISKDLQFIPENKRAWLVWLEQNNGKKVVININLDKAKRSLDQNAYYHAYLDIISSETGNNSDDLHRLFKGLFLPKKPVQFKGKTYMMSGSTTELNKPQFSEYLDKIASECGIPLPDPKLLQDSGKVVYPQSDETNTPNEF